MKASEITLDRNMSFLFKGPWGHAKTLSAASFALGGTVRLNYWDKKKPVELVTYFKQFGEVGRKILENIDYEVYGATNANQYLNHLIDTAKDCRYFAHITDSVTNMTSGAVNWSLSFRDDRKNKDKLKVLPDFDEYKVETSLVTQALDICRILPCHVIWIAHPVPGIKIEGSGASIKVTKVNPIVTYGSKVAGIVPGNFSEIYHFGKQSAWDQATGKSSIRYLVSTDAIGDDFAKSNLGLKGEFDITDQLFYSVWKQKIKEVTEALDRMQNSLPKLEEKLVNPFAQAQTVQPANTTPERKWNSEKGAYE